MSSIDQPRPDPTNLSVCQQLATLRKGGLNRAAVNVRHWWAGSEAV